MSANIVDFHLKGGGLPNVTAADSAERERDGGPVIEARRLATSLHFGDGPKPQRLLRTRLLLCPGGGRLSKKSNAKNGLPLEARHHFSPPY
jgi:hypothetical protein